MVNGRGAWNAQGVGGTKQYKDATKPGPYYYLGTGAHADKTNDDQLAVFLAVKAYQRALNRRLSGNLNIDGKFGPVTSQAVTDFQNTMPEVTGVWGGIGPDTSKQLLLPDLRRTRHLLGAQTIPLVVLSGTINHESLWDAGAVGFLDPDDIGLAQINGRAHPDLSFRDRCKPLTAFTFVIQYYMSALEFFDGNLEDAIASYNLGKGGASRWISQGRPDLYTPEGSSSPRNVREYIDSILEG